MLATRLASSDESPVPFAPDALVDVVACSQCCTVGTKLTRSNDVKAARHSSKPIAAFAGVFEQCEILRELADIIMHTSGGLGATARCMQRERRSAASDRARNCRTKTSQRHI